MKLGGVTLRFLRQPSSPTIPRPAAKSGRAAGSGTTAPLADTVSIRKDKLITELGPPRLKLPVPIPTPSNANAAVMSPGMAGLENNCVWTLPLANKKDDETD